MTDLLPWTFRAKRHKTGLRSGKYIIILDYNQEIDYLEEVRGRLMAVEFKWRKRSLLRPSRTFSEAYPDHTFRVVTPDDYLDWLTAPGVVP